MIVETGLESNVRILLFGSSRCKADQTLAVQLKFYTSQGWKIINEENPAHFDDMDGQPMPLWVITSVRSEEP